MAKEQVVRALIELGFDAERSEAAAEACGDSVEAAVAWLVQRGEQGSQGRGASGQAVSGGPGGQVSEERSRAEARDEQIDAVGSEGPVVDQSGGNVWSVVGGWPEDPLVCLADTNQFNLHDTGDGWVVMHATMGQPLLFIAETSTWYGKMFAGGAREVEYILTDVGRRPIVKISKAFGFFSQEAKVSYIVAPENAILADRLSIGSIKQETTFSRRTFLVSDSTPHHAAGDVTIEAPSFADKPFTIKLGDSTLGTIMQPKNGLGVASISLHPNALDPFRSNRMRALLIAAAVIISDVHWGMSPGPATILKALPH
ncbi:hypothetical protein GUITHDRAFT_145173 [Guillardia theta CCMP2712]|uniref:UBA domain-containing protein n=2 Tax=Guillardia theta TaxID=55529 RepID=L1ILT3_GUITC|nr:hypothetical protein GUITHDRAFT_145173 [Guillardia theta CCMP2712]EKX37216.1 hypothetical protein GUITHDRAFT_145173 [Guillardia theta CCMP2712]|mmetsp:Transcript_51115/g.159709  ORF Transcript_51115/g.159709 Transcript_51115/m.159709 type:complete len:313 (+) Transcript_51115:58-996(+)|eukprot:XP_005824196.1 hypothetical protein GUITHDRAFT_145173 [Guillardia theta CCMP2712]